MHEMMLARMFRENTVTSFKLKYELTKGSQAAYAHVFVDNQYQWEAPGAPESSP